MPKKKTEKRIIYSCGYDMEGGPNLYNAEEFFNSNEYTPTQLKDEVSRYEKAIKARGWTYVKIEYLHDWDSCRWMIYGWKYETDEECAARLKAEEDKIKEKKLKDIEKLEDKLAKLKSEVNQCDGCARGLPLKNGVHKGESMWDSMVCTKDRYEVNIND